MAEHSDVNAEELKDDINRIKDAMGLQDRYPTAFRLWLVFGGLVLAAALASQFIELRGLPGYWHAVVWFLFMGAGGLYQGWAVDEFDHGSTLPGPNVGLQFGAIALLYVVFLAVLGPALDQLPADAESIVIFSLVVALIGVAYLVVGESLKAYRIRRRDRYAFYVGGVWMLLLAVAMPNVAVLETWGYAAFGVVYAIHAVGSYLHLS